MTDEITIRRARRGDVAGISALVRKATRAKLKPEGSDVMDWLFSKGLWLAVRDDEPVGVAAWQAENLLSVTDVFYVSPAKLRARAGGQLLETIEAEAATLMCEANVLVLPAWTSQAVRGYLQKQGYEPQEFGDLHRIWREVLGGFEVAEAVLLVKRLRDRMVMVPI
jgi:N-acetylglutamate synthase-like GNAT family acetyltransferase